jgi:hypothetical protein
MVEGERPHVDTIAELIRSIAVSRQSTDANTMGQQAAGKVLSRIPEGPGDDVQVSCHAYLRGTRLPQHT